MSENSETFPLEIKDVYDFAYDIAQDFEKLLCFVDIEEITPLINRIINVLESLESSIRTREHLEIEVSELRSKCSQLSHENASHTEEKLKLNQTYEELDESWAQESVALKNMITKLQVENISLKSSLAENDNVPPTISDIGKTFLVDQEECIEKLKSSLKIKNNQLEEVQLIRRMMQSRIDQLLRINQSLRVKCKKSKALLAASICKKDSIQVELYSKQPVQNSVPANRDVTESSSTVRKCYSCKDAYHMPHSCEESVKPLLQEHQELLEKVSKLQIELAVLKCQLRGCKTESFENQSKKTCQEESHLKKIMQLFLGVINIDPQLCWLRQFSGRSC